MEEIFSTLGLSKDNGLYITQENRWKNETSFPNRVKRLIERKIEPTAFFCFDNKPIILFFDNPENKADLHEAIWNFNESPIAIIIENDSIEIFNGFAIDENTKLLKSFGGIEKLNDFSYFELVTGRTWEQYKEHLDYKNRVDYHLLQNIKSARQILVGENEKRAKLVNAILGKVIFVRYLIDRKVKMKFDGKLRTWTNTEFCELLDNPQQVQAFFEYLEDKEKGFNGDLFPLSAGEYKQVRKSDYQVLKRLLLGNDIATNQQSLFELYDFSIIPIEFISNVYELFIGQDNQKKEGAYYTPLFLVDYILKETVEKKLSKRDSGYNCRVLDPACGSGIFLVETLRKIIEKYVADTGIEIKSDKFKTAIKNLAKKNIYGIDKDLSAVQVAIFSIYLTLLDYLEPPGIETFKFPVLFNTNFFEADFFDEKAEFNTRFKEVEFDYILGNPPWKGNGMDKTGNAYLKNRKNKEKELNKKFKIAINNNEIAEGFVLRVSDFCKQRTKIAFIIRSSSLYNLGYNKEDCSPFRQYLLEEYFIDKVFELAPVRHEVFEKSNQPAIAPAAVIFYHYANGENTDSNIVQHIALKQSRFFSLFKIFTINRSDYKKIQQSKLKEFDWLWKVLVYGSYLDFNFIRKLKAAYLSIKAAISNEKKFIEGTGIQYSSNPNYNSKHLIGKPFMDSYGLTSFFILPEKVSAFEKSKVHRLRDERLFKAPMLLVREGIDMETLTAKCVLSKKDVLFKDSITSIKALNKSDLNVLNNIAAIFSTSLFSYYAVNTFASIGIERERVKNYNKYSLPYFELNVNESIERIERAKQEIYSENRKTLIDSYKIHKLESKIDSELEHINNQIYRKLQLEETEATLIDYALQVSRGLMTGDEERKKKLFTPLPYKDNFLKEYAQLFLNRFQSNLSNNDRKFIVEIWHTDQIVGMLFKVVPVNEYKQDIDWKNKQNDVSGILPFLIKISSGKITDKLFVQKDVRGFENEDGYFYIFKPNEKSLWHKAIGYLDVQEFSDAILKAGREAR
ncbi:MAG: N-6 DNA methylase [Agriterribacter sp.]